ncbi:RNA polymerase sigma-70 factor [Flexithrix dorotheae]|uniref:RNA polymerase sigma-70 factor n=1 Tax=Flexithrix dorotheae TaxID=70993 RepID=UPI0003757B52|nr:RNA polymerase sigma-70 factor [Flexithrix dorotheae]
MPGENKKLLKGINQGEEWVFNYIFDHYYAMLCVFANKIVGDFDTAEDIVQGLILKLWEERDSIQIKSSLKAYLFQAVKNKCYNHVKQFQVRNEINQKLIEEINQNVENAFAIEELSQKIYLAIASLPPQCRKIFKLSRFSGLKHQEIADQYQISVKTVKAQISKALQILREQLKDYIALLVLIINVI